MISQPVADRQGSIVALSDYRGDVLNKNAHDPYGVPMTPASGESVTARFGCTGQM